MLHDIVIDANVLCHADNNIQASRPDCQKLVDCLINSNTLVCVDEGFDWENEAKNRSQICAEYLLHLQPGSIGYHLIAHLAQMARLSFVPRKVPQAAEKHIRTQVNKGPDRLYLKVTFNSQSKKLASHDFGDIPAPVRTRLKKAIGISVLKASEAAKLF
jgi:hypothetical protein